jgi:peptidoglycan/xylan/chitin deacetylase (PgdA/CDA1 family)
MRLISLFILPLFLWGEAHIFLYHRFNDPKHSYTNTSIKTLIRQFEYLKTHGYKVVDSRVLLEKAKNGENVDKLVAFHIDDSFKSFYKYGLPVFKKYKYPFTLFVYVEGTDKHFGDFMTWDQLREVAKYGDIQCHSYSHPHLTKLSDLDIIDDTMKALNILRAKAYKIDSYAYPYGEYNNRVKKILAPLFKYIYNQNEGAIDETVDIQDVPRIALTGDVKIASRLKIKNLKVKNFKVIIKNNKIIKVSGYVPYKKIEVYITKLGWKWIKTKNGYFEYYPDFKLKKFRNRVILRYNNEIKAKMVTKS